VCFRTAGAEHLDFEMYEEPMIAQRTTRAAISATLKVSGAAKRLRATGVDVVDLSVGEPDFPTPDNICEAAHRAIDAGMTRYTANAGTLELRQAIVASLAQDFGLEYAPHEVIVSNGAKQAIFNAYAALLDEGDEVLIAAPYWVSYPEMARLVGAKPVIVPTSEADGFKLRPDVLRKHLGRAKVLTLNSPSNPTGCAYDRDELAEIVSIALDAGLVIVSDEIYAKLLYDGASHCSVPSISAAARARTVLVNGLSKTYAMTGWRIGYAAAPREIIDAMDIIQSHSTSNACAISQAAALEALRGPQNAIPEIVKEFAQRRDLVLSLLTRIPGWTTVRPRGAFYVFPNVRKTFGSRHAGGEIRDVGDLATYLIEVAHVAAVPGDGFGAPDHLRFSYAASTERLTTGFSRVAEAIQSLGSR